jgi:Tfp pilus assembly protein PilF
MTIRPVKAMKVFYCYARKDKSLRDQLGIHLAALKREGLIVEWYDHDILPGADWAQEIDTQLNTANIILLLISSNFMHSDYCYNEMCRALDRHKDGKAHVIPIILRPITHWEKTPIGTLQVLPTGGKPIMSWSSHDEAFRNVAEGIAQVANALLKQLREQKTSDEWLREGNLYSSIDKFEEAFIAYEHALACDPTNAGVYNNKSWIYNQLERYEEALAASEQAFLLDPTIPQIYTNKSIALQGLGRIEEAQQIRDRFKH